MATVLLTLTDGECSFQFLKQPCRKTYHRHINVKNRQYKEYLLSKQGHNKKCMHLLMEKIH